MILGPVFWMELVTGARRARHFITRTLLVAGVFAVVGFTFLESRRRGLLDPTPMSPSELAEVGEDVFASYSISQFLIVLCVAPLYSAGAVAGDRERRVLELVLTTRLRNIELVASKWLVRTIHLCALVVAGLPVMFLCLLLGGVSAEALLATIALTLVMVLFVASFGLLVSIGARRAHSAIILTYLILLIAWLALPFLAAFMSFAPTGRGNDVEAAILSLNPWLGLMGAVHPDLRVPVGIVAEPHWLCVAVYGPAAMLIMIVNVLIIRRLGLWASRERVVRDRKKDRRRRTRRVWDNPVAWREVRTIAVHRRMRWARLLCLVFSFVLSAVIWIGWLADWMDGRRALAMDIGGVSLVIAATATVAWLLMTLQGSVCFSHEREQNTLDALLTTPLSGSYIVLGKLAGIMRSSAFALAFPIAFTLLAWSRQVTTFRAALLTIAVIVLVGVLAACWGLACSVWLRASGKASGLASGAALVLCLGVPLAAEYFLNYNQRQTWTPVVLASPSTNVSWSIYDESVPGPAQYRGPYFTNYRDWDNRLASSSTHLLIALGLGACLAVWAVRRIEQEFRVRQFRPVGSAARAAPATAITSAGTVSASDG